MAISRLNMQMLKYTIAHINGKGIGNLTIKLVEPSDKRCSCEIEIKDMETKQKFGLLANSVRDIDAMLPKLLEMLLTMRDTLLISEK